MTWLVGIILVIVGVAQLDDHQDVYAVPAVIIVAGLLLVALGLWSGMNQRSDRPVERS